MEYSDKAKGLLMGFTGFFLFSCCDVIAKKLTHAGYPTYQISFFYAVIACIFLSVMATKLGGIQTTFKTRNRKLHLYRSLLQALTPTMIFYGFSQLPLANGYAILFLMPFLGAVFAIPMLKEHPKPVIWMIIAAGFAGVIIAMRPDLYGFSWPVIALLAAAIMSGIRNNIVRLMPEETALSLSLFPSIAIVAATFPPTLMNFHGFEAQDALMIIIGGGFFAVGILMTSLAFRYAKASTIAPTYYSQLIWGVAFGMLFFANTPDLWTVFGLGIIAASGIALIRVKD